MYSEGLEIMQRAKDTEHATLLSGESHKAETCVLKKASPSHVLCPMEHLKLSGLSIQRISPSSSEL